MNFSRFIFAVIALFIFIFVYEAMVHGYLLMGLYSQTPDVWRPIAEMKSYTLFNTAIMGFLSVWLAFMFTCFYRHGGAKNGLRFGFLIGVLSGLQAAGAYFYLPISLLLACAWFAAMLVESILGGFIIGLIYRN